ncbi:amidohydrolase [Novosphingobium sp. 1949]|uniref:Amidohydrolase n=1 Tax=Novosphingobium organovorum TaxID=2930092 RepID=A0ABT0BAR4_9SPHN|nr:amidohydrolase [Novosphingobium organovorum]MCJ2182150.1 amidohydrolase [Novosphingobium organovorum]
MLATALSALGGASARGADGVNRAAGAADLVIVNASLLTVGDGTAATALAVADGKIVAVGTDAQILALRDAGTKVIDAHRHTVLPGFNDNHAHLYWGARALASPDVRDLADLAAIQKRVAGYAQDNPDTAWVQAGGWLPYQIPGGVPDRSMLDAISTTRPIVLWALDRHSAWVNTKALELAGITRSTPNPPEGLFVKDPRTGEPTGWLKEISAVGYLQDHMPALTEAQKGRLMERAMDEAHKYGVTSINEAFGDEDEFTILDGLRRAGKLTLRVTYALGVTPDFSDARFADYQAFWKAHPATPLLKTGVVKFFLDGVPQADTAYLLEPWGPQKILGKPIWSPRDYTAMVTRFDAAGWQIMTHAMGDAAVREALDGYEAAEKANPAPARGRRHRIEHAFLVNPADIPRFARLGVIAAYQPNDAFIGPDAAEEGGKAMPDLVGRQGHAPQDGGRWNAIRAAGGRSSLGSDWPVFTMNALTRIYALVNAKREDLRVSLREGIDMYTRQSAYTTFSDTTQGSLAVGQFADIVILSRDLENDPPTRAQDLAVDQTIFNGTLVYSRP